MSKYHQNHVASGQTSPQGLLKDFYPLSIDYFINLLQADVIDMQHAASKPLTRLFLGFRPEATWTASFTAHRSLIEKALTDFNYRWVPPANYHMTLHYLGACTEAQKQTLLLNFPSLCWNQNFSLTPKAWTLLGQKTPRSLTLEFDMDLQHNFFQKTKTWVAQYTDQAFAPETFRPHITFGKHKGRVLANVQTQLEEILAATPTFNQPMTVMRCALFETRIKDARASYVPLLWT